jgi:hypothetical protein
MMDAKERQRGYSRKYEDKRRAAGDTKHIVWLSAEATAALETLEGRKEDIFSQAIIAAAKNK